MDLNISSEKIGNPLLVELLKKLTGCFGSIGQTFFVIGATARDIILQQLASTSSSRKTRDLDVAIAIPDWRAFDRITKILVAEGFNKDTHKHQRFYYDDYELDVVPYGVVAKEDDYIYWPPEEVIAMSVKGFDEVLSDAITVHIDDDFELKIASLHGLFLLKFNVWQGNVRLYLAAEEDRFELLTKDHVFGSGKYDNTFLTRCVNGKGFRELPPIGTAVLNKQVTLYLCTDGFYQSVAESEINGFDLDVIHKLSGINDDYSLIEIKLG